MSTLRWLAVALPALSCGLTRAAETFSLSEDPASGASWSVVVEVTGSGTFRFQPTEADAAPQELPVSLKADYRYVERRLPAGGRDESAFRSLRDYERATSSIQVQDRSTTPRLREARRRIVAAGSRSGVTAYSTGGPLTPGEVELLPYPGDSLLLTALLPARPVAVAESWSPDPWVASAIVGVDVAFDQKATCRLEAVRDGRAVIHCEGRVEGAIKGATAEAAFNGAIEYDLAAAAIVAGDFTQTETRSIGPLSPGMSWELKSTLRRSPAAEPEKISDADAEAVPLEAAAELLRIEHPTAFDVSLASDRDWQHFQEAGRLLHLRLLDRGGLIAQCNVTPGPKVDPGRQTSDQTFQEDIRKSLGDQLTEVVAAEEVRGTDHAIYRVTSTGVVKEEERVWRHYLVTAADGRQVVFVFTTEPANLKRLADRDLDLVRSLKFSPPAGSEGPRE